MNTTDNRGVDVRRLALIALMAAVICVLSPLAIPLSAGVPISLATLAVMLAGAVLGPVDGMLATARPAASSSGTSPWPSAADCSSESSP